MTEKMKTKDRRFIITDILLLVLTILPIVCGIIIYILTAAESEGIKIAGAQIYFTLNTPLQPLPITESQVNSALVIISVFFLCLPIQNRHNDYILYYFVGFYKSFHKNLSLICK